MAKPMILYGRILSPYLARCAIAANAKGLAYDVQVPAGGLKTPAYLKMNPLGRAPVLKDGKTVLYESGVIVDYLNTRSRKNPLLPKTAKAMVQMRLPGAIANEYIQPHGIDLFRLKRGTAPAPVDPAASGAAMMKGLDVLEAVMAKGRYAAGTKFSVADCFIAPALFFATRTAQIFELGDAFAGRPKLAKYWKAIQKDKFVEPVIAVMRSQMDQALAGTLPPMY